MFVDAAAIAGSTNHQLLASGLVYPTYYSKLFVDLRAALNQAVAEARAADRGVWPDDLTTKGVTVDGLAVLTDTAVAAAEAVPAARRLPVDQQRRSCRSPACPAYLAHDRDDRVIVASTGQVTGFDNVLEVDGQTVRATRPRRRTSSSSRREGRSPDGARQAPGDRR